MFRVTYNSSVSLSVSVPTSSQSWIREPFYEDCNLVSKICSRVSGLYDVMKHRRVVPGPSSAPAHHVFGIHLLSPKPSYRIWRQLKTQKLIRSPLTPLLFALWAPFIILEKTLAISVPARGFNIHQLNCVAVEEIFRHGLLNDKTSPTALCYQCCKMELRSWRSWISKGTGKQIAIGLLFRPGFPYGSMDTGQANVWLDHLINKQCPSRKPL